MNTTPTDQAALVAQILKAAQEGKNPSIPTHPSPLFSQQTQNPSIPQINPPQTYASIPVPQPPQQPAMQIQQPAMQMQQPAMQQPAMQMQQPAIKQQPIASNIMLPPLPTNRRIKILIGTPAFGGMIHTAYFNSVLAVLSNTEVQQKYEVNIVTIGNDALVQRARQEICKIAMDAHVDKLLFVDADLAFTAADFLATVGCHDKLVVGGTYRKKTFDPLLNYNIKTEIEVDVRNKCGEPSSTPKGWKLLKAIYADKDGLVPALHVPTGFMCIDCRVFDILKDKVPRYVSDRRHNTKLLYSKEELDPLYVSEFFPVGVRNHILESEDWRFCSICRDYGIDVWLQTKAVCPHVSSLPLVFPME